MKTSQICFRCFAAANTYEGFCSYYDEMLKDLKYCYIIKGGPGTGKSSFMKKISESAKEKDHTVTEIYCSSDPDSLDGLIINDLSIGFTDGTSPHTRDPKYPKIKEEIIDLAKYIDKDRLTDHKDKIVQIIDRKTLLYRRLYTYLASKEFLTKSKRDMCCGLINENKMYSAIERIINKYPQGKDFISERMQISAYSAKGSVKFDTYSRLAKTVYNVNDKRDIGYVFFNMLYEKAKEHKLRSVYSCRPTSPSEISDIYFPEIGVSFITGAETFDKNINLDRFYESSNKTDQKTFKFIKNCTDTLGEGVNKIFSEIEKLHFELEKYYISAIDFRETDILCDKIIKDLL